MTTLPPIHPALVHLPIAFVLMSFLADLAFKITNRDSLRHVGLWSMVGALAGGILAIAAGYWDMNHATLSGQTHGYVDLHLKIGWGLAVFLVALTVWRWRIRQQARERVTRPYLASALLVFMLTMFQGWFGGEMVYSQGAGVAAAGQGTEPAEKAQERLARVRSLLSPAENAVGGTHHQDGAEHGHGDNNTSTNVTTP